MRKIKLLLFIILCQVVYSQTTIKGVVKNTKNIPLQGANVLIKKDSIKILNYTYTNDKGIYELEINNSSKIYLIASALGYQKKEILMNLKGNSKEIVTDIILKEKSFELDEIIIQTEKSIKVKKDTIEVSVDKFLSANDVTVEDLLKKIPGVTVDTNGTIKIGNQEIEKLMIDGDDFFDKGYKILSKNMPPDQLKKIQILQKYSNNRLLKNIEKSDKVALNLVLKEDAKRQWFGNFSASYGLLSENRYQLKSYAMNFGKKNKYIILSNFNNTGIDATGDIQHLIKPFRFNEPGSIGDNQQINNLIDLSALNLNFKKSRTNFNNAELLSLNAIFNPTDKIKIKTLGFFNWDEKDFFRKSSHNINTNNTAFTNNQNQQIHNKKKIAFGKLDLIYTISKTKTLETTTRFNNGSFNDSSDLVFNNNSTIENLYHQNTLFDQKISFTNKFSDRKVVLITGRFIDEKSPQNYKLNQFFYQNLFPNQKTINNITQQNTNKMLFSGVNLHLLQRKKNNDLLELKIGNEYRKDELVTTFSLLEDDLVLKKPSDYQNETLYSINELYAKSKYSLRIKKVDIISKLNFYQTFNNLRNKNTSSKQNPFFINPSLGIDWEINTKNKISSSYAYNTSNAKILDVFSDFVLTGFRSFSKGTSNFNQLNATNFRLNYQLGNWSDRFFTNTYFFYGKNHDFFSTNTTLNQNFTQAEKILIKNREFIVINSKIDYYFKFIHSNLKIDIGYTKSDFQNSINNSNLRKVTINNYNYGFQMRSGFSGVFNYHFGSKWNTNTIQTTAENSFTDNTSFLDLSFVFNEKIDFQLQTERYFFGNLKKDNTYYFLDFDARYKLIKNKLTLGFSGKNLLNTKTFRNFSINDTGSSTTEYKLLPRYVLLNMEYRF